MGFIRPVPFEGIGSIGARFAKDELTPSTIADRDALSSAFFTGKKVKSGTRGYGGDM
jgi:hypothetical protein